MLPLTRFLLLSVLLSFFFACQQNPQADILYYNASIWTGDSSNPQASVIAIKDHKILYVGSNKDSIDAAEKIDLKGQFMTPGFIDNHTHFLLGGFALSSVQLKQVKSKQEFIQTLSNYCKAHPGDSWIKGGDWNNDAWGGEMPNRTWIDSVTGDHPLFITRYDGHTALANTKALDLAKINRSTKDPFGGRLGRNAQGELTGILKDEAMNLVQVAIPQPTEKDFDQFLQTAAAHAIAHGLTQVHDMSIYGGWNEMQTYQRAYRKDSLPLRIYSFVPLTDWEKLASYVHTQGKGDDYLRWGGVKGFVDGSLGSTTAWFYEPYLDDPNSRGMNITDTNNLKRWVMGADSAGLQVVVHAIGDRANDFILDAYAAAIQKNGNKERKFRVEHAQHMRKETMQRYKELGVVPSMHPYHVVDDGVFAPKRLEDARLQGTYAFKSLLQLGVPVCFGSDWTVAPLDPLSGIYAAVTRQTSDGKNPNGWYPNEKITVDQALRCYTVNNANAVMQGNKMGMLKKGMLADLVVINQNLFKISPEKIKDAKVVMTVINGKVVYKK